MSTNNVDNTSYAGTEDTNTKVGDNTINNGSGSGKNRAPIPGRQDINGQALVVEPPRKEDLQPSYARVISGDDDVGSHGWYGGLSMSHAIVLLCQKADFVVLVNTLGSIVGTMGAIPCCIICPNPYKPVSQGNVGLVTKYGRFYRAVDPGLVKINPLSEKLIQVDVKIQIVGRFCLDI